jgi:hypothetical protein
VELLYKCKPSIIEDGKEQQRQDIAEKPKPVQSSQRHIGHDGTRSQKDTQHKIARGKRLQSIITKGSAVSDGPSAVP